MKKILLLCSVLAAATALAEPETYSMKLKLKDGRTASYVVNNIEKMTFRGTSVEDLPDLMTVEEKVSLCSGDFTHFKGVPRLEIPEVGYSDGPRGRRHAYKHRNQGR